MVAIVAGSGLGLFNTSLNSLGGVGQPGSGGLGQTTGSGYVNTATGNLVLQALDEQRSGRGGDLYHLRTYNSLGQLNDADADGWRWDGERKLVLSGTVNTVGSTVTRTTGDGHETVYAWDATNSRYSSSEGDGAHDTLTWNSGTSKWSWTDGSTRTVEVYTGSTGRLETVTDTTGNIISYGYDANGRLNLVKDNSTGQELILYYGTGDRLSRLDTRSSTGGTVTRQVYYSYDGSGRLTSVRSDLSPTDSDITDNNVYTTTYTYDGSSFRIASIAQSDGTTVSFTYTLVSSDYRVATVTDRNGTTTYSYDTANRRTTVSNGLSQVWTYTYDANNQLVQVQTPSVNGQLLTTSYVYDALGNVTQVADGRGNIISYSYDTNGNRILERDALGNTVKRTYDSNNQLQNEVHYSTPATATTGTALYSNDFSTDTTGLTISSTPTIWRDAATGRLVFKNAQEASTGYYKAYSTTTVAQEAGTLFSTTVTTGSSSTNRNLQIGLEGSGTWNTAAYRRDVFRIGVTGLYVTSYNGTSNSSIQLGNISGNTSYKVEFELTAGGVVGYFYAVGQTRAQGFSYNFGHRDMGAARLYVESNTGAAYTGLSEMYVDDISIAPLQWTDPPATDALTTRYVYDSSSRLRFVVTPEGGVTEYRYGTNGLRSKELHFTGAVYDVSALLSTDTLAESTLSTWAAAQTASTVSLTDYAYDAMGNLSKTTVFTQKSAVATGTLSDPAIVTEYVYDYYSRLLQTIAVRGSSRTVKTTLSSVVYDGVGRVQSVVDASGTTAYTYDGTNRQVVTTTTAGLTTTQTFDTQGRLSSVLQSATGETSRTTSYVYDAAGRLTMTEDATGVRSYVLYDEADRVSARIDGTGAVVEYVYNANGQVTSEIRYATQADTSTWFNGTSVTKTLVSQIRPSTTANDRTTQYSYDNANRLATVTDAGGIVTTNSYDGDDRLLQTVTGDRTVRFFYDKDGRQVGLLDAEGYLTENIYSAAGQLRNIKRYVTVTTAALRATGTLADLRPTTTTAQNIWNFYSLAGELVGRLDEKQFFTQYSHDRVNNADTETRYGRTYTSTVAMSTAFSTIQTSVSGSNGSFLDTKTEYDTMGRVLKVTNPEGTITQNEYDTAGRLIRSTTASGTSEARSTRSRYNAFGQVTDVLTGEDAERITIGMTETEIADLFASYGTHYVYDTAGRQARVTDRTGAVTVFYYDAANRLTHTINAAGEVRETQYNAFGDVKETTALTARLGYTDAVTQQQSGGGLQTASSSINTLVAAIRDANKDSRTQFSYNTRGLVATKTDAEGYVTSYAYTNFGQLDTETRTLLQSPNTTVATQYTYDKRGLLLSTAIDPTGLNLVRSQAYDAYGRITSQTDATGKITSTAYTNFGRTIAITDPLSHVVTTTYDAWGRTLTVTDALGNATTYAYSNTERSITVTTPEGIQTKTIRNIHGETLQVIDGKGGITSYAYNKNGQLLTVTDAQSNVTTTNGYNTTTWQLESTTDALGNVVTLGYDAVGRVLTRSNAGTGNVTRYEYDGQGRQVKVTEAEGTAAQKITSYAYDRLGQVLTVTTGGLYGSLMEVTHQYDGAGQEVRVEKGSPYSTANREVTSYAYDKAGRRVSETRDPSGLNLTTQYKYDKEGRVTRQIDPLGNSTWYVYYSNGLLSHSVNALGEVTRYLYDGNDRQISVIRYATRVSTATFGNAVGSVTVTADAALDQQSWTVYDGDGRVRYQIDALRQVTEYRYDANGRVIETIRHNRELLTPDTSTLYTFDTDLTGLSTSTLLTTYPDLFRYDPAGYLVVTNANNASVATPTITSVSRDFKPGLTYKVEIRIGATIPARMLIGVTNTLSTAGSNITMPYRRHVLGIAGGNLTSDIYSSASTLGAAETNTTYVLEIVTRAGGTTMYVYKKDSQTRETGYKVDYDSSGWETIRLSVYGIRDTGGNGGEVSVDNFSVSERTSTEFDGVRTRAVYDSLNRQIYEIDALGYVTEWQYDVTGNVTAKRRFDKAIPLDTAATKTAVEGALATAGASSTPPTTTYIYDTAGRLVYTVDALRQVTQTSYDLLGRVITTTSYGAALGGAVSLTLAAVETALQGVDAHATYYYYDALDRLRATVDALGQVQTTSYYGPTTQVAVQQRYAGTLSTMVAGDLNWLGSQTGNLGDRVTSFTLKDALGRTKYQIDALKNVTEYVYDTAGRVIQQIRYGRALSYIPDETLSVATLGQQIQAENYTAAEKIITQYVYDKADRLRYTIDAGGGVSEQVYDARGNVIKSIRYTASITLPGILNETNMNSAVSGKANATTQTVYDALDRVHYIVNALNYVSENVYDSRGNLLQKIVYGAPVSNPGSLTEATLKAALQGATDKHVINYYYDAINRLSGLVNALGEVSVTDYLGGSGETVALRQYAGRLSGVVVGDLAWLQSTLGTLGSHKDSLTFKDALGQVRYMMDAQANVTEYRYSTTGQTLSQTRYSHPLSSPPTSLVSTAAMEQLVLAENYVAAQQQVSGFLYDASGRLVYSVDALGYVSELVYDGFGNVQEKRRHEKRIDYTSSLTAWALSDALQEKSIWAVVESFSGSGPDVHGDAVLGGYVDPSANLGRQSLASDEVLAFQAGTIKMEVSAYGDAVNNSFAGFSNRDESVVSSGASYRKHGITIRNRSVYLVSTSSSGVVTETLIDSISNGERTDYVLELKVDETGTTLTVYDRAYGPQSAFVSVQENTDWGEIHSGIYVDGIGDIDLDYVSYLRDEKVRLTERNVYDELGRVIFTTDASGYITENIYNAFGQLSDVKKYDRQLSPDQPATRQAMLDAISGQHWVTDSDVQVSDYFYTAMIADTGDNQWSLRSTSLEDLAYQDGFYPSIAQLVSSAYVAGKEYRFEVTGSTTGEFVLGFANRPSAPAVAKSQTVRMVNGAIYVGAASIPAMTVVQSREYVIELVTNGAGTTLYMHEKNQGRGSGIAISQSGADWQNIYGYAQSRLDLGGVSDGTIRVGAVQESGLPLARSESYKYDSLGRMVESIDALGQSEKYEYDAFGNRVKLTNRKGDIWTYTYDALGHLTEEISPQVSVQSAWNATVKQGNLITRNTYDAYSNVVSRSEGIVKVAGVEDNTQLRTTTYGYDALNRQILVTQAGYYNKTTGAFVTASDGTSNTYQVTTEVTYDSYGNAVRSRLRIDNTGDPAKDYVDSYKAYDLAGRAVYEVDALSYVTTYGYDAFGNQTSLRRYAAALGATASPGSDGVYSVQELAALVVADAANDREITTSYDIGGRKIRVQQYASGGYTTLGGTVLLQTDKITEFTYTAFGEVASEYVYGSTLGSGGQQMWNGQKTGRLFYYDDAGQRTGALEGMAFGYSATGALAISSGYYTAYEYDAAGQLVHQTDYANQVTVSPYASRIFREPVASEKDRATRIAYDALGRQTKAMIATGISAVRNSADNLFISRDAWTVSEATYDALGRVTSTKDALGNETKTEYNAVGGITKVTEPKRKTAAASGLDTWVTGLVNASPIEDYSLDAFGNAVVATRTAGTGQAGATQITKNDYDAMGNVTRVIDAEGGVKNYKVDAAGRTIEESQAVSAVMSAWTDINGVVQGYSYTKRRTYEYDVLGRQVVTADWYAGNTEATRNSVGFNAFGEVDRQYLNGALQMQYYYDRAGNVVRSQKPGNGLFIYTPFPTESAAQVISEKSYDIYGHVIQVRELGVVADAADDRVTTNQYDALGRLVYQELPAYTANVDKVTAAASTMQLITPVVKQRFDRWGNVIEQESAIYLQGGSLVTSRSRVTAFEYDYANRLIKTTQESVAMLRDNATTLSDRSIHETVYDRNGNAVQQIDYVASNPNGKHITSYVYSEAGQLLSETDAVGIKKEYAYDAHGNRVAMRDGDGVVSVLAYDKLNQLVEQSILRVSSAATGIYQRYYSNNSSSYNASNAPQKIILRTYKYDAAGRQYASIYGGTEVAETLLEGDTSTSGVMGTAIYTKYDERGNIVATRNESGRATANNTSGATRIYEYNAANQKTLEMDAGSIYLLMAYDSLGNLVSLFDQSRHVLTTNAIRYTYDAFGQRKGDDGKSYTFYENGLVKSITSYENWSVGAYGAPASTSWTTLYEYDYVGNKVRETNSQATWGANPIQAQTASQDVRYGFDILGRLTKVTSPAGSLLYEYDIGMNRDRFGDVYSTATLTSLTYSYDEFGNRRKVSVNATNQSGTNYTIDNWYKYDAANKMTIAEGMLVNNAIVAGVKNGVAKGESVVYDNKTGRRLYSDNWVYSAPGAELFARNKYFFNEFGNLEGTGVDNFTVAAGGNALSTQASYMTGNMTSLSYYDLRGNALLKTTIDVFGFPMMSTTYSYRGDGMLSRQKQVNSYTGYLQQDVIFNGQESGVRYIDDAGRQLKYIYKSYNDSGVYQNTGTYLKTYKSYGSSYKETSINISTTAPNFLAGYTKLSYDGLGRLQDARAWGGTVFNRRFAYNGTDQIIGRTDSANNSQTYFYVNGNPVASIGTIAAPEFDYSYEAVSDRYPSTSASTYTVVAGDTLTGIAQAVFGDGSLWYLIADANGLGSNDDLIVGATLQIPNVVSNVHNNSKTFKPYSPNEVIGDVTPSPEYVPPPPPPRKKKCGALAMIVMVVVAVVATVLTAGVAAAGVGASVSAFGGGLGAGLTAAWGAGTAALAGTAGLAGLGAAVIGGAAGSAASQLAGKAMGVVDDFSWRQVALGGLGAGLTAGVGAVANMGMLGSTAQTAMRFATNGQGVANYVARGVLNYATSYAANKMAGTDFSFSWKGVASSVVSSFVSAGIDKGLGSAKLPSFMEGLPTSVLNGQMTGATMARLNDQWFGGDRPDYGMVAADAFGNTLGAYLKEKMAPKADIKLAPQPESRPSESGEVGKNLWDRFLRGELKLEDVSSDATYNLNIDPDKMDRDLILSALNSDQPAFNDTAYTVGKGDKALEQIARRFGGEDWRAVQAAIYAKNGLKSNKFGSPLIYPGQKLTIPDMARYGDLAELTRLGGDMTEYNTAMLPVAAPVAEAGPTILGMVRADNEARRQSQGLFDRTYTQSMLSGPEYTPENPSALVKLGAFFDGFYQSGADAVGAVVAAPGKLGRFLGRETYSLVHESAADTETAAFLRDTYAFGKDIVSNSSVGDIAGSTVNYWGNKGADIQRRLAETSTVDAYHGLGYATGTVAQAIVGGQVTQIIRSAEVAVDVKFGLQTMNPSRIGFTQSWVSYQKAGANYNFDTLVDSMKVNGWMGKPVDVVVMPDGVATSIDNTRILAARQANVQIQANAHAFDEVISDEIRRASLRVGSTVPSTWGEAALLRINKAAQNDLGLNGGVEDWSQRFPYGSLYDPNVVK